MLAIRLQRTGRSGHSQFRLVAQDSHFSPKRGRVVAYLGSYDPHTKEIRIDSEKASEYLEKGAQPSNTAARLMQKQGIKLPTWVKLDQPKNRDTRNPDKRRSSAPAKPEDAAPAATATEEAASETSEAPAEEVLADEAVAPVIEASPVAAEDEPTEEPAPAETPKTPETPAE